ncbi:MAG: AraC family transcriptional regulator [Bacteroidota bacterium]
MMLSHQHFDLLDKIVLERVVFQPPFRADSTMQNEACFMHVLEGRSRLFTPEHQYDLTSRDSLVMKCGSYLNRWFANPDDRPNEAILVHLYPDVLEEVYAEGWPDFFDRGKKIASHPVEKVATSQMIQTFIQSLQYYFDHPGQVTEALIRLKVKEIVLLLVNSGGHERIYTILGDLFRPQQYKFREIIHAHLFENLSLPDLAVLTGFSLSSFKRKFKAVFGTSPVPYIRQQRLEKARELLRETGEKISHIAYDCGFNDLGYFSKSFHAAFGLSPTAYRQSMLS